MESILNIGKYTMAHKVLHIVEATASGTLSMVSLLANSQSMDEGCQVSVAYSVREETPEDFADYFDQGVLLYRVDMSKANQILGSILKLRELMSSTSYDAVFMHSSIAGFVGRLSASFLKVDTKLIYVPHCISFMRQDIGFLKKAIFIALERLVNIVESVYVACSVSEMNQIKKYIPSSNCVVIENAIDKPPVSWRGGQSDRMKVITVGHIREQKDPMLFVEIARKSKEIGLPLDFIWVGDGEKKYVSSLIAEGVVVTGWAEKQKVLDLLSASDVYLSTSSWEGMPVSVIEALYVGVPVVARSCAGNIDVVEHRKNGFLYSDLEACVDQFRELIRDRKKSECFSRVGRQRAIERYSKTRYVGAMKSLYA